MFLPELDELHDLCGNWAYTLRVYASNGARDPAQVDAYTAFVMGEVKWSEVRHER